MLLHGDELGRTQQGNNNTYCQDSELTWVHWDSVDQPLVEFTAAVNSLRAEHPTFRRSRFFDGRPVRRGEGEPLPDIVWLNPDGNAMPPEDWDSGFGRSIGVFLNGDGIQGQDHRGRRITDDNFLLYFNAHDDDVEFKLPPDEYAPAWDVIIDTADQADTDRAAQGGQSTLAPCARQVGQVAVLVAALTQADRDASARPTPQPRPSLRWRPCRWPEHRTGDAGPRSPERGAEAPTKAGPTKTEAEAKAQGSLMRTPVSTYRLQIRPGFTLQDAAETVPYLKSLGVDWIYLSPILTAEQGSDHGYDVTDPSAVDPDRGGPEGLAAVSGRPGKPAWACWSTSCPTTSASPPRCQNPWWWSLLKEGRQSRYAQAFDVDWDFGGGRIRIPVLGEDADLDELEIRDGELRYYDHRFPLADGSYTEGTPRARSTTGSTTNWWAGAGRTPS